MSDKVKVDDLADYIVKLMKEFEGTTDEACKKGVLETADDAVQELRNAHPAGSGQYHSWNEYNKGWKKRASSQKTKLKGIQAIVFNEKHYQLTHLLEKGHALVKGGHTAAFPHIAPVEQKCEENLIKNIKKNI